MQRKRATPPATPPPPPPEPKDFGPDIRLAERPKRVAKSTRKKTLSPAAQRRAAAAAVQPDPQRVVEKEYRFDPEKATPVLVRGGRVRDPLRKMWTSGYITKRQWEGAEGFRDDCALAAGARLDQLDESGVRSGYGNSNWPTEAQIAALNRVRRTMARLEPIERELVVWSLLQHRSLGDFSRAKEQRNEDGGPLLRRVLDRLARHHG